MSSGLHLAQFHITVWRLFIPCPAFANTEQQAPGQAQERNQETEYQAQAKGEIEQGSGRPKGFGFLFNGLQFIQQLVNLFKFFTVSRPKILTTSVDSNACQGVLVEVCRRVDRAGAKQRAGCGGISSDTDGINAYILSCGQITSLEWGYFAGIVNTIGK